jgi:hypothetical protein
LSIDCHLLLISIYDRNPDLLFFSCSFSFSEEYPFLDWYTSLHLQLYTRRDLFFLIPKSPCKFFGSWVFFKFSPTFHHKL